MTESNTYEIVEMPEPLGLFAGQLFDRAREYLSAFRLLAEREGEMQFPKYFALTHAVELFLKSYLATQGIPKLDLRSGKKFGHQLDKLFVKCEELGMPVNAHLGDLIGELNEKNSDYDFRYPSNYILRLPSPRLCLEVILPLEGALLPIVTRERNRAQVQWAAETRHLRGCKIRWSD
ncbi:hypothetical protein [Rhizobium sp. LjRoot258]|uniref:hypothetical protein n=1 Tax=Rhizobium sp. LjRoot258 TaxID=3342299 RepID=UPI003F503634